MMALVNRLSWLLLAFVAVTSALTLVVVGVAALLVHWSLPLPQTWLLISAAAVYLLVHDAHPAPSAPPLPPPPEAEVSLEDLEALRRMWQHGDIAEAVYRRAVAQATRRYVPPPPPPAPPRRRRW
jgi:hypothetical protein